MLTTKTRRRIATIGATVALLALPAVAFAGHVFNDVADDSPHIDGITWVKNSGVSVGCDNNGNYCPTDKVSREQMGTFMYRLSGNDPATDPSVNADRVDGFDANELVRAGYDQVSGDALVSGGGATQTGATVTIEAPGAGILLIDGSADLFSLSDDIVVCRIEVNGDTISASARAVELDAPNADNTDCSTNAGYTTFLGGTFTVDLVFSSIGAGVTVDERALTVLYVPFNTQGNQPTLPIVLLGEDNG